MSETEVQQSSNEKLKLSFAALLLAAAFVAFFMLREQAIWLRSVALVIGLLLSFGVFSLSSKGRLFLGYTRDSYRELSKVVWPTRKESMQMTGIVFAFVVVMSIVLGTVDWVFSAVIAKIFGWN